jgi:hypothetical protein
MQAPIEKSPMATVWGLVYFNAGMFLAFMLWLGFAFDGISPFVGVISGAVYYFGVKWLQQRMKAIQDESNH